MRTGEQRVIRMIAADMDGTLLGADGQVSPRTLAALMAAESAGVRVVVATGRRHSYARRVLRGLGFRDDAVLVSSYGAVVRTMGESTGSRLIEKMHMEPEAVTMLLGLLGVFRNALVVTLDKLGAYGEDARGALVVEELATERGRTGRSIERLLEEQERACWWPVDS